MEELLDEGLAGVGAVDEVGGQFAAAAEGRFGPLPGLVRAGRIDRPDRVALPLLGPVAAERVELLEREAERVDHRVAGLAGHGLGLERDPLAGGEVGMGIGSQRHDRLLRRLEHVAQHAPREEHAPVDRRRLVGVGQQAHQVGMREHARAAAGVDPDRPEGGVGPERGAVERGHATAQPDLLGGEEPAEAVAAAVERLVHRQKQARPQVGEHVRRKLGVLGRVLGDLPRLGDPQPVQQEVAELGLRAPVGKQTLGVESHLVGPTELLAAGRVPEVSIRQRVAQAVGEPGGHHERIAGAGRRLAEQESGRLEREQHRPLDRRVEVGGVGEGAIDHERLEFGGERMAEGPLGESAAKLAEFRLPVRGVALHVHEVLEVGHDVVGGLLRHGRRRREPFRRHARAPVVADAPVVGREGRGGYEQRLALLRREAPLGHRFQDAVRRLPEERDRGAAGRRMLLAVDALVGLRELERERIRAAAEEEQTAAVFVVGARLHPAVEEGHLVPGLVEPQPHGVFGADHELVGARLRREQRARPADREPVRPEHLRVGALDAEVEVHSRIDPLEDEPGVAVEVVAREILPLQAPAAVVGGHAAAEAPYQVGEGVVELAVGESGQFHAGGPLPIPGHGRVEGPVDVLGHLAGRVAGDRLRVVFRHRVMDVFRELVDRAVARERRRHVGRARPVLAVAPQAVLAVDGQARVVGRRVRDGCRGAGEHGKARHQARAATRLEGWWHQRMRPGQSGIEV